jgi:hypothetical protein
MVEESITFVKHDILRAISVDRELVFFGVFAPGFDVGHCSLSD